MSSEEKEFEKAKLIAAIRRERNRERISERHY